jgi:hypothetical protein
MEQDKSKIDMGSSVFKMEDVNHVLTIANLNDAKKFALDILEKSTANDQNKKKIKAMIVSSKTLNRLALAMSSCILAHPSNGLKVL